VLETIPDHVVDRDTLGPVLRLAILAAASTGLRQSELLGMRWKDVDLRAQRVRVRNAWVRYEHSGEGKSDLSTRRSVPLTDRRARELMKWRLRAVSATRTTWCSRIPNSACHWTARRSHVGSRMPAS
jgi:integrase